MVNVAGEGGRTSEDISEGVDDWCRDVQGFCFFVYALDVWLEVG